MSDAPLTPLELEAFASSTQITKYIVHVTATLLIYDYVLTLKQEIDVVWRRRFSLVSVLLIMTRWSLLLSAVSMLILPFSKSSCKGISVTINAVEYVGLVNPAIFAALRVSAIWGRNWFVFLIVLTPGITTMSLYAYIMSQAHYEFTGPPVIACEQRFDPSTGSLFAVFYPVIIAGCVTMHTLLLILTWAKTYRHWRRARQLKLPVVVTTYLLRDGTLYFFIMFVVSLIQLLIYVKGWPYISILLNVMPPILVIRFLFNLRQHESRTGNLSLSESGTPHGFSIPYLSSIDVFGNIGEPVNVDPDENGEGEELHENAPLGTL